MFEVTKIKDFIDRNKCRFPIDMFLTHYHLGTAHVGWSNGEVEAIVRYNIAPSGKVAEIIDLVCEKNGLKWMREFCAEGKKRWPSLEYIKFFRQYKYSGKPARIYKLNDLIRS